MLTYIIIAITVVVSVMGISKPAIVERLSLYPYRIAKKREWYRVVTHLFVHGDYSHLFINMFVFWSFGLYIEDSLVWLQTERIVKLVNLNFLLLYMGGGVFASLFDVITKRNKFYYRSVGASGGVAAVLFASIFLNPWSEILFYAIIPIPAILFGVFYIIYESYMAKRARGNVNHRAHLLGALYGFIFMMLVDADFFIYFIRQLLSPKF